MSSQEFSHFVQKIFLSGTMVRKSCPDRSVSDEAMALFGNIYQSFSPLIHILKVLFCTMYRSPSMRSGIPWCGSSYKIGRWFSSGKLGALTMKTLQEFLYCWLFHHEISSTNVKMDKKGSRQLKIKKKKLTTTLMIYNHRLKINVVALQPTLLQFKYVSTFSR